MRAAQYLLLAVCAVCTAVIPFTADAQLIAAPSDPGAVDGIPVDKTALRECHNRPSVDEVFACRETLRRQALAKSYEQEKERCLAKSAEKSSFDSFDFFMGRPSEREACVKQLAMRITHDYWEGLYRAKVNNDFRLLREGRLLPDTGGRFTSNWVPQNPIERVPDTFSSVTGSSSSSATPSSEPGIYRILDRPETQHALEIVKDVAEAVIEGGGPGRVFLKEIFRSDKIDAKGIADKPGARPDKPLGPRGGGGR